jgi:hypothetical protein
MTVVQHGYDANVSCLTQHKLGYDNTDSDVVTVVAPAVQRREKR